MLTFRSDACAVDRTVFMIIETLDKMVGCGKRFGQCMFVLLANNGPMDEPDY
jgi:hypothetical protein